jgi:hypothetical protein
MIKNWKEALISDILFPWFKLSHKNKIKNV